jgi:hypothetical protein
VPQDDEQYDLVIEVPDVEWIMEGAQIGPASAKKRLS